MKIISCQKELPYGISWSGQEADHIRQKGFKKEIPHLVTLKH